MDALEARLRIISVWTKSECLEREFGVTGGIIRNVVRDLRRQGIPIASGDKGYKLASNIDEILPTCENLRSRAISELFTVGKLERNFIKPNSQDGLFAEGLSQLQIARLELEKFVNNGDK